VMRSQERSFEICFSLSRTTNLNPRSATGPPDHRKPHERGRPNSARGERIVARRGNEWDGPGRLLTPTIATLPGSGDLPYETVGSPKAVATVTDSQRLYSSSSELSFSRTT
jgi:hypothetical protein